jgi:hypothetical protein
MTMTFDLSPLIDSSNDPAFLSLVGGRKVALEFRVQCVETDFFWNRNRLTVRRLAGDRMTDRASLMNEFESVLQLYYFGLNWDALSDWIRDLAWMKPGAGFVFLVTDAGRVLEDEPTERANLIDVLQIAAGTWSLPVSEGATRGQPAVPFHFVLADSDVERIAAAWGSDIPPIELTDDQVVE